MLFRRTLLRILGFLAAAVIFLAGSVLASAALPRDALQATVRICAAMMSRTKLPLPCSRLEWQAGFEIAILDPPFPGTHRLVVPVAPVTGIEDKVLLGPAGAAYFAAAWRTALAQAGDQWSSAGLAVNSARVRSQDQLHFHADCLNDIGRTTLQQLQVRDGWHQQGRRWVITVKGTSSSINPFALIHQVPQLAGRINEVNIGIFGSRGGDSWVFLADVGWRSFEDFLTPRCA